MTITEPATLEVEVRANLYDWFPGEIRTVDLNDREALSLLRAGLVLPVDPELRDAYYQPPSVSTRRGCGCKSR